MSTYLELAAEAGKPKMEYVSVGVSDEVKAAISARAVRIAMLRERDRPTVAVGT